MIGKTVLVSYVMLVVLDLTCHFQAGGTSDAMQQRTFRSTSSQNRNSAGKVQHTHIHHHYYSFPQGKDIQKSLVEISAKLNNFKKKLCPTEDSNIALGKPTAQSSTGYEGISYRAVDGNTNGVYGQLSCTHTNTDIKPWWRVDLGSSMRVVRVVMYNRVDCCRSRLSNFDIRVGNSLRNNGNNNALCASGLSLARHNIGEIYCHTPLTGRYLTIQLPGSKALTLCEVRVYSQ